MAPVKAALSLCLSSSLVRALPRRALPEVQPDTTYSSSGGSGSSGIRTLVTAGARRQVTRDAVHPSQMRVAPQTTRSRAIATMDVRIAPASAAISHRPQKNVATEALPLRADIEESSTEPSTVGAVQQPNVENKYGTVRLLPFSTTEALLASLISSITAAAGPVSGSTLVLAFTGLSLCTMLVVWMSGFVQRGAAWHLDRCAKKDVQQFSCSIEAEAETRHWLPWRSVCRRFCLACS
mmetsp:Transcript_80768/g.160068  ORF Transcript_80768/g.160068 Transcript_80768/m.160068 type:complete len:237 (-) Transcript_80768:91-801(-)